MVVNQILKLSTVNFRNLNFESVEFSKKINCLFGKNGNGKTNLLEAIYYCCQKKSFRKKVSFPQLLSVDCEEFQIIFSALFSKVFHNQESQDIYLSGKLESEQSHWFLDNRPIKKFSKTPCIFVNPFDSFQFHTSSTFRRTWLDSHLSLVSLEYKKVLNQYQTLMRNRNALLGKKPPQFREMLNALTPLFAEYWFSLTQMRREFLAQLSPYIEEKFHQIFSEEHKVILELSEKNPVVDMQQISQIIVKKLQQEIDAGRSLIGPQLDDYVFYFDGMNSYEFCSLGQQKSSYLALIFAYIELFRYKLESYPIVLIDDVSGELDKTRWKNLISFLEGGQFQVFITTANEEFKSELQKIDQAKKFEIDNGNVEVHA